MNSLVIVSSYHHGNTEKIAKVIADVLGAKVMRTQETDPVAMVGFDLIGFGSGIYGGMHDVALLELVDKLPRSQVPERKAFIFSTSAIMGKEKVANDHGTLRENLQAIGYEIIDEFACKGYNTNSFLKYIGGMNRGRPNDKDLQNAEEFARKMMDGVMMGKKK